MRTQFTVPPGNVFNQSASIVIDGYNAYLPEYTGSMIDITIPAVNGSITVPECCVKRGDVAIPVDGQRVRVPLRLGILPQR